MIKFITPIKNLFLIISAVVLVIMMLMTALDVGLRYLFNKPIPGGLELVEFLMVILVPFALVVTAYEKAHVGVDIVLERLSEKSQLAIGILTELTAAIFFSIITWQNFLYIGEQQQSGLTSAVLLIPHHPFIFSLATAFLFLSLISFWHFIENSLGLIARWTR